MYGSHIGTGAGGSVAALMGLQMGSAVMIGIAIVLGAVSLIGIMRRVNRTGAHQRP